MGRDDLSKKAYDYLFERIVANDFTPGTNIVESEICEKLGMSRTPVREALRRLESEGLVYRIKDVGTMVKEITYEDILEVFEIRILYELHALKSFVEHVPEEEIRSFEKRLTELCANTDNQEYYNVDRDLHKSIMRYCSNSRMINNLNTINAQIEKLRRVSATTPQRLSKSKNEHLSIVRAVCERNYEKARRYLEYHLEEVKNSVIAAYRSQKAL
jgi:DNA-binding GntR family transcriptional regulator